MKKLLSICSLLLLLLCSFSGCSRPIRGVGTAAGRLSKLEPADSIPEDFMKGYHDFSCNLFRRMYQKDENIFLSPASMYIALGMTSNGARGGTLSQISAAMGTSDADKINAGCKDLQSILTGNPKKYYKLANAIWLDESLRHIFRQDFLDRNEEYFGALIAAVPFNDALIPAINKWAEKSTDGMVKNVLKPPLDPDALMFLSNSLLFDGKWEMKFKKGDTKEGVFHGAKGDINLPMMHRIDKDNATLYEDDRMQATLLDYQDKRTAMLIVLPKGSLDELMAGMTGDTISGWINNISACGTLNLTLPRFSLAYKSEPIKALKSMGITDAFDPVLADFGRIAQVEKLTGKVYIDNVIHQTALEVDESGTRAAAVAFFHFLNKGAGPEEHYMVVDRPFFCAIIDKPTGAVIFEGAVCNPVPIK